MLYDSSSSSNQPSFYISVCPFTDSAIFWAVCPSFPVLLLATSTQLFNMALSIFRGQLLTPVTVPTLETVAGLGCGAMGGGSQERYQRLQKLEF